MNDIEGPTATAMRLVVTLKSGVQIKADVEDFTTGASPVFGELRKLKWTTTERPGVVLQWLDISEVAAVHAEYDWPERPPRIIPLEPDTAEFGPGRQET